MTYIFLLLLFNAPSDSAPNLETRFPQADRLIAIGDVHGDFDALITALELGGLIDEDYHWIGGKSVLVQTGDQLDRGDQERKIVDLLVQLESEAEAAGGKVHVLNGNHELMNAALDFRYVTDGGFAEFADLADKDPSLAEYLPEQRGRVAAFRPGGVYAKTFANRNTVVIVGDTIFVHGGVLPQHVQYGLERFNQEIREWLWGISERPESIRGSDSPIWSRHYSNDTDADDCALLDETLQALGLKRIVVGHTVQKHPNAACEGKVWRIDVGMAAHYGGEPAVLEIKKGKVHVLRAPSH